MNTCCMEMYVQASKWNLGGALPCGMGLKKNQLMTVSICRTQSQ